VSRRWGQHFLRSNHYLDGIASCIPSSRVALEIGGGSGNLTRKVVGKIEDVLYVSEIDPRFHPVLQQISPKIRVLGDFLKLDLGSLSPLPESIFGNLPYFITSRIIEKTALYYLKVICPDPNGAPQISDGSACEAEPHEAGTPVPGVDFTSGSACGKKPRGEGLAEPVKLKPACFLVQREVAHRIVASPGSRDYSRLSVLVRLVFKPEKLFDVPPGAFSPPPEVHSSLVKLTPLKEPPLFRLLRSEYRHPGAFLRSFGNFISFVRLLFNQRNRKLSKVLRWAFKKGYFEMPKTKKIPPGLFSEDDLRTDELFYEVEADLLEEDLKEFRNLLKKRVFQLSVEELMLVYRILFQAT